MKDKNGKEVKVIHVEPPTMVEKQMLELYFSEETKEFLRELLIRCQVSRHSR